FASSGNAMTRDIYFVFTSDAVDWTSGKLNFLHNAATPFTGSNTFRPTFTGRFNYAGPVAITNNTGNSNGKTELQSANTSGTQTWSGAIEGTGRSRGTAAGGATVLSGANSFTGGTFVDNGTLTVSGSI